MGLVPSCLRLFIRLHGEIGFKGPVICLGNPDIWASCEDLKKMFVEYDQVACEPSVVLPHTSDNFRRYLGDRAKVLFEMMGITDYTDVDKFDADKPMMLHDMNLPAPDAMVGKFNLVLDAGTIEHVFDVRQMMANIVNMVKPGGRVVHVSPASNYIDHSFYQFSPTFFYDFYQANGFGDFRCRLLQLHKGELFQSHPFFEYTPGMQLEHLIDGSRRVLVFFTAQRTKTINPVVIPTQGYYREVSAGTLAPPPAPSRSFLRRVFNKLRPPWKRLERI